MGTYWPDLILPTTLADRGGSAEDRTMAWSALTGVPEVCAAPLVAVTGSVTEIGRVFALDREGGREPAREKMGTEEMDMAPGRTPRAVDRGSRMTHGSSVWPLYRSLFSRSARPTPCLVWPPLAKPGQA